MVGLGSSAICYTTLEVGCRCPLFEPTAGPAATEHVTQEAAHMP